MSRHEGERSEALRRLDEAVKAAGSIKSWSEAASVSPQYVSDVLLGRRAPGPAILLALGLVRVVSYEPSAAQREVR